MSAFYNENDPKAAAWLRELISAGHIAPGIVDERSISDIRPEELYAHTQCHFFAGIAGWSLALRLAGVSDDCPIWTGSCPCQPYSVGSVAHGGAKGPSDSRDLWSAFAGLIEKQAPPIIFGEQVASAIAWGWWDRAARDLEANGYATGAAVLPACGYGAEHERKRLFWMADSGRSGREGHQQIERLPFSAAAAFPIDGNPLVRARRALAGDYSDLLPCDGLSVQLERDALRGYGNAIVPQVAATFIQAAIEALTPATEEAAL